MRLAPATLPFPDIDPYLIHISGSFGIRWYALSYIAGLLLAWWLIARMLREPALWRNPPFNGKPPATPDNIGDLFVWATFGVILGGRIGWDLFYGTILCAVSPQSAFCAGLPGDFLVHPIRLISAWQGGMSFHGGLIGVAIAIWLFCRVHKLDVLKIGDLAASVAPIGLFFGRIANFVNGELWGRTTDVPWAMVFCTPHIKQMYGGCPAGLVPRHPSQLYEAALEGVVLFLILQAGFRIFRWHEKPGLVTGIFFAGYGIFRFLVEFVREPDGPFLGWFTMGMALTVPLWLIGAGFAWYAFRTKPVSAAA